MAGMAISIDDAAETAAAFLGQCMVLSDRERGAVGLALREARAAWSSRAGQLQVSSQTVHKLALSLASALASFRSAAQRAVGSSKRDVLAQGGADGDEGLPALTATEHVLVWRCMRLAAPPTRVAWDSPPHAQGARRARWRRWSRRPAAGTARPRGARA